jgi:hypothetical protein
MKSPRGLRVTTSITKIWDRLFLGTLWNAEQLSQSNPYSIASLVNCTDERINWAPQGISEAKSIQLDHQDGIPYPADKVYWATEWMHWHITRGPVLVVCHAGWSRSPGMVLAYLIRSGMGYKEALFLLQSLRPQIQIANAIDLSVRQAFGISPRSSHDLIGG